MKPPSITIGTNKIRRLSGFLFITSLSLLIIRYNIGDVQAITNVVSYFTLCIFLFMYLFTGKVVPVKWSAYSIVAATWIAITTMGLFSGGTQLPLIVLYPVIPAMALVMLGKRASLVASGITIFTLILFIILDLAGYNFDTLPLNSVNTRIMRSFWLIFTVGVLTLIEIYYINRIEKLTHTLQSLADSDYITGLPSRKMLDDTLRREYYRATRLHNGLSLLLIEIDNLNQLYETAGHMMGDECLRLIADAIHENFRRTADYTGRFSHSQYMVILTDSTHEAARDIAEKIRNAVDELKICIDDKSDKYISVSIACLTSNNLQSMTTDSLLDKVNELLKNAKAEGGNKILETEI